MMFSWLGITIHTPVTAAVLAISSVIAGAPVEAAMSPDAASDEPRKANRLAGETSPYLLQHAYNPVDWYPWGEEAFERARLENKPIFLSVGYSTCYWCHVMERESFESPEVAEFMNKHFINVKVDREERPDVDDVYMTAVQLMTQQGGWPMSVFLEPESLKPFFGGTYFPPQDQGGRPGFLTLAASLSEAWNTQQELVREQADKVADAISRQMADRPASVQVGQEQVDAAVSQLLSRYDEQDAGYGGAPKFPMPVTLDLLMESGWEIPAVRASVLHTLDRMAMGGMYDQVGGGFHRYSTDAQWLVPHFEKMLYDNGMLASVYARACERTGDEFYCAVAREILEYTLREMTAEGGAFLSAQDAESNAREGESYLWTPGEVREVLAAGDMDDEEIELIISAYGLDQGTNFQDPHHPGDPPTNVLYLVVRPDELAAVRGLTGEELHELFTRANALLLERRDTRDQPLTDDKIIAGWNGLMIGGMADTGRLLKAPRYTEAAANAASWIRSNMWSEDGGLLRTARGEQVKIEAFLEDYALLIRGLISLYAASGDDQWLVLAEDLTVQARDRFWDETSGGWYDTQADQSDLLVRGRSLYDGALPSGSGSMLLNLVRLKDARGDDRWDADIKSATESASWSIERSPTSTAQSTQALARVLRDHPDVLQAKSAPSALVAGRVTVSMAPAEVVLKPDHPTRTTIVLVIDKGWHVASPVQEDEFTIGMSIASLDPNLSVTADWPEAHAFEGPDGPVNSYEGTIRIPITLTATGPVEAEARVMLTWQACNDRICDRPETRRLPLVVQVGGAE
ncbi:MAG: DUF255 domain-containing protein [Phycisphaerales bacterium]|nr:DUF255 domain-containing protein [Phycisphaerales bacterium]